MWQSVEDVLRNTIRCNIYYTSLSDRTGAVAPDRAERGVGRGCRCWNCGKVISFLAFYGVVIAPELLSVQRLIEKITERLSTGSCCQLGAFSDFRGLCGRSTIPALSGNAVKKLEKGMSFP